MKKLFLYIFCLMCLVSCEKEEITMKDQLLGEWVYDHPDEGVWEKLKFIESGLFYYSNDFRGEFNFSNDLNDGRYSIYDNNKVEISYTLNGTAQMGRLTVQEIKKYSFTAEFFTGKNESVGVFTYAKLLRSYEMERGERILPDYATLVQTDIRGFKSHNTQILRVDEGTGEITAVGPGLSYVDVITEEGTAVVEIKVAGLWPDYTTNLGQTMEEVKGVYGVPYWDYNSRIYYKLMEHEFIYFLAFTADITTNKIYAVNFVLKEDCDWQIALDYLRQLYYFYEKGTVVEDSYYAFTNKKTLDESNIGITFDGRDGLIGFIDLTYDYEGANTRSLDISHVIETFSK